MAMYSEGAVNYCKYPSRQEQWEARRRRDSAKLHRGMAGEQCLLCTIRVISHRKTASGMDTSLRKDVWHPLSTRIRQIYPDSEYMTVYEHAPNVGTHLHVVVKRAPGLTLAWVAEAVARIAPDVSVHIEPVYSSRLAAYLTKQIANPVIASGWPKHFRVATCSRGWCPDWVSAKEWRKQRRGGR